MNTVALPVASSPSSRGRLATMRGWAELFDRQRHLAWFGLLLLLAILPMAILAGVDERMLRGVGVWIKPIKFSLSIAVLAWTTAWFIGHLVPAQRGSRAVKIIVRMVIAAGGFELAYITLQAALGQASHYNVGDPMHAVMYSLMGLGALVLTATQPLLAWQLYRHGERTRPAAYRLAVLLGLSLTFVFGAGVGALLSALQPPTGPALPLLGWSLQGGDLRPAHFVGIHAEQFLPLVGLAAAHLSPSGGKRWVWAATAAYAALFAVAVVWGSSGRA